MTTATVCGVASGGPTIHRRMQCPKNEKRDPVLGRRCLYADRCVFVDQVRNMMRHVSTETCEYDLKHWTIFVAISPFLLIIVVFADDRGISWVLNGSC